VARVVQVVCDRHLRKDNVWVPVNSWEPPPTTLDGITRGLVLCPECRAMQLTLDQWAEVLRECGTRVEDVNRPPSAAAQRALAEHKPERPMDPPPGLPEGVTLSRLKDLQCPFDDCDRARNGYQVRASLNTHIKTTHGYKLSRLTGRGRSTETPKPCTWPGCNEVLRTGAGLRSHLRSHQLETAAS